MAIVIREYLGSPIGMNEGNFTPFSLKEGVNTLNQVAKNSLMVDIEGIHVGPTRNFTWYTEQALKSSIPTWTRPYNRPLILHHNEKDGKIIGRVLNAHYTDVNTRSKTGALVFTCNVPDKDGKEGVENRILETVSIGVIARDVRCSICGHVISEHGECEHERGTIYDGETCYWMIYEMEAKELSYVIVPSDMYAHNLKIYSPKEKNEFNENLQEGVLDVTEATKVTDVKEGAEAIIAEDADKKDDVKIIEQKEVKTEETDIETVDVLKETIATLKKTIEELEGKLKVAEDKATEANEIKTAAEQELVAVNNELKEFASEQIMMLREKLGRTTILKESLMKRTKDSLIDSIIDLKEEVAPSSAISITESTEDKGAEEIEVAPKVVEVKESVETEEVLSKIEKPIVESLVDEDKDTSIKKEKEVEKKSELDVKESTGHSNTDYEATVELMSKYYNL